MNRTTEKYIARALDLRNKTWAWSQPLGAANLLKVDRQLRLSFRSNYEKINSIEQTKMDLKATVVRGINLIQQPEILMT